MISDLIRHVYFTSNVFSLFFFNFFLEEGRPKSQRQMHKEPKESAPHFECISVKTNLGGPKTWGFGLQVGISTTF